MNVTTPMAQDTLEEGLKATRKKAVDRTKERCYCLTLRTSRRHKEMTKKRLDRVEKLLRIRE